MAGRFEWLEFSQVDLSDSFFDSLKHDYLEFSDWFKKKSIENAQALVFKDEKGIVAFLYLKEETEKIEMKDSFLPAIPRIKIGTLKLDERFRGQRLGEGAIGVALWKWQESLLEEIYVTVFQKHEVLTTLFSMYGFKKVGENSRGEAVYLKNRESLDYTDAKKSFPFINPYFTKAGILPIEDNYHDKLFPYSELHGNDSKHIEEITAGNGVTKIFIASPFTETSYRVGEPIFIYRKYDGPGKTYKSVITSFGCVVGKKVIKNRGREIISLSEYLALVGNKSVFSKTELIDLYNAKKNLVILVLLYNGYFGKGNNVNHHTLSRKGLFETHPYKIEYTKADFESILMLANANVKNIILD